MTFTKGQTKIINEMREEMKLDLENLYYEIFGDSEVKLDSHGTILTIYTRSKEYKVDIREDATIDFWKKIDGGYKGSSFDALELETIWDLVKFWSQIRNAYTSFIKNHVSFIYDNKQRRINYEDCNFRN